MVSESSLLLGGVDKDRDETATRTQAAKAFVVVLGAAFLVVMAAGRTNPASEHHVPSYHSFDEKYHAWEASLYQSARPKDHSSKLRHHHATDEKEESLVYFNHTAAFNMLQTDHHSTALDFFHYQQGWEAQINQAFCALASSAAAMNSLRGKLELPQDPVYVPFPWATQMTLVTSQCVRQNIYDIDEMQHEFWGLGLDMAAELLNCHLMEQGYKATAHRVDPNETSEKEVRQQILGALRDDNARVVINYDRGGITQGDMGHGHFSPIAAYNEDSDAFLVMDVAKYKYPPVWVPTSKLMGGIGSIDDCAIFTYPDHPFDSSVSPQEISQQIGCQPAYRGFMVIAKD